MKLSVFLPTIRTHLLEKWYDSLCESCNRHDFEVIFCGPFDIPSTLTTKDNVKFIKDYGNPTRAAHLAALQAEGEYLYHTVDDILFYEGVVSEELDYIDPSSVVAMRYNEGVDHSGKELPFSYWYAAIAYPNWPGVNQSWGIGIHFIMTTSMFRDYGGFDCRFEYLNHSTHDLLFRIQKNRGVSYRVSKRVASTADWMPGTSGDHAPIHYAQTTHDEGMFQSLWLHGNNNSKIDIDNWNEQEDVWQRRFSDSNIKQYKDLNV